MSTREEPSRQGPNQSPTLLAYFLNKLENIALFEGSNRITRSGLKYILFSGVTLLIGFILGVILLLIYIPVVMIENGLCGCLGTLKETALKVGFEASKF